MSSQINTLIVWNGSDYYPATEGLQVQSQITGTTGVDTVSIEYREVGTSTWNYAPIGTDGAVASGITIGTVINSGNTTINTTGGNCDYSTSDIFVSGFGVWYRYWDTEYEWRVIDAGFATDAITGYLPTQSITNTERNDSIPKITLSITPNSEYETVYTYRTTGGTITFANLIDSNNSTSPFLVEDTGYTTGETVIYTTRSQKNIPTPNPPFYVTAVISTIYDTSLIKDITVPFIPTDDSFNTNSENSKLTSPYPDAAYGIVPNTDDTVTLAGFSKHFANGYRDTGYNSEWYNNNTSPPAETHLLSNGKILGKLYDDATVVRYNVDGTYDNTFNYSGGTNWSTGAYGFAVSDDETTIYDGGTEEGVDFRINVADSGGTIIKRFIDWSGGFSCLHLTPDNTGLYVVSNGETTTYSGTTVGWLTRINVADGTIDTSFSGGTYTDGSPYWIDVQPDGKVLIAGGFITYNGDTVNGALRLNTDGTRDTSFNTGSGFTDVITGNVEATYRVLYYENKIYYTLPNYAYYGDDEQTVYNVVELNTDGSLSRTHDPDKGSVQRFAINGGVGSEPAIYSLGSIYPYKFLIEEIPDAWCSLENGYEVDELLSTPCDGENFIIRIPNYQIYKDYYVYELFDANDVSYGNGTEDGDYLYWAALDAGWYKLVATPITSYLRDSCEIEWIDVSARGIDESCSGTPTFSKRDAICGSFNQQAGRLIIDFDDASSGLTKTVEIWGASGYYYSGSTTGQTLIIEPLAGDYYYVTYNDGTGVNTNNYDFVIDEELIYSVPNIKEIYVSEWSSDLDWNYWSTDNDPDYYGGVDTLKFQSTKIKEYTDTGMTWYYIPVDETNVSFGQALSKVRQGIIWNDTLSIGIPYHDEAKWNALSNVLTKRYVVVFKDNNDQWWTFGYQNGAKAEGYTFSSELGGFTFNFTAVSEDKIITSIAEEYVETYIK